MNYAFLKNIQKKFLYVICATCCLNITIYASNSDKYNSRSRVDRMPANDHVNFDVVNERLLEAIVDGDHRFVQGYLLGKGQVNVVDYKGRSLLERAAARGHKEIVINLLEYGACVDHQDDTGNTALYMAALGNHSACVNLLIEAGAPVNQADQRGVTALHTACHKGYFTVVEALLACPNITIDQKNKKGQTALWFACLAANRSWCENDGKTRDLETIVQLLLEKKANPNQSDHEGTSLLHWSSHDGHLALVERLLHFNADVNAVRYDGTTPLMIACYLGKISVANLLLSKGPDLFMRSCDELGGGTAYNYALQQGYDDLAYHLQQVMMAKESEQKQDEMKKAVRIMEQFADKIEFLSKKVSDLEHAEEKHHHVVGDLQDKMHDLSVKPTQPVQKLQHELTAMKDLIHRYEQSDDVNARQLDALQRQHEHLWRTYQSTQQIEEEKQTLRTCEATRVFYDTVFGKLQSVFNSYQMLDMGMVQRGTVNRWDRASQGISLLGSVVSLPFAGLVTSVLSAGASAMGDRSSQKHVDFIVKRVRNPEIVFQEAEESARLLTVTYKNQILQLSPKGSETLAECGIGRIMDYMQAERIEDGAPLSVQFLEAVATFSSHQGFCGIRHRDIETRDPLKKAWTDKGIFQKVGIETRTGLRFRIHETKEDESNRYGFRLGTEEEASRLGYVRL